MQSYLKGVNVVICNKRSWTTNALFTLANKISLNQTRLLNGAFWLENRVLWSAEIQPDLDKAGVTMSVWMRYNVKLSYQLKNCNRDPWFPLPPNFICRQCEISVCPQKDYKCQWLLMSLPTCGSTWSFSRSMSPWWKNSLVTRWTTWQSTKLAMELFMRDLWSWIVFASYVHLWCYQEGHSKICFVPEEKALQAFHSPYRYIWRLPLPEHTYESITKIVTWPVSDSPPGFRNEKRKSSKVSQTFYLVENKSQRVLQCYQTYCTEKFTIY